MTTDLATLTTAADRWDGMAKEFGKRETDYKRDVHGITPGPPSPSTWTGLSADAAGKRFDVTLHEFRNARTEAKAIASLLRDAHAQFTTLRGRLKSEREAAVKAGIKVSDRGVVAYDEERAAGDASNSAMHDPTSRAEVQRAVESWQGRIDKAVRAVGDADEGVEIALGAAVFDSNLTDGTGNGFNSRAKGDIEQYEAEAAKKSARKLANGERLTPHQLAELQRSFRDNSHDPGFSRTVLDSLGPSGTIRLTNNLGDLAHVTDPRHAADYNSIETGLANSLATATKNTRSKWYKDWRTEMRKAGVARYETDFQAARLDKVHGYQSLVTLMQHGDGYGREFLEDLGDDMIKAEKKNPEIWDLKGEYSGKQKGWFANDPVDGVLGIMSHEPATAAHYLNDDDRMKYLTHDRDWKITLHTEETPKATVYTPSLDADTHAGFAAALQAGATGLDPSDPNAKYVEHSADNNKVFKSSLKYLAEEGDKFPPSLREPMAKILVNHGDTVHAAASRIEMKGSSIPQDQLYEVVKQVSKDQGSYAALNSGINHAMVADIHDPDQKRPMDSLSHAGRTVGFLEQARTAAAGDPEVADFKHKWVVDQAIGYLPVGSDEVQSGFDYVTEKWLADEQRKLDDKAADADLAKYNNRNSQLMALAEEWRKVHHTDNSSPYDPQDVVDQAADTGALRAQGVSKETAK
ncbi:hypothetical protein OHO83_27635 [Streptomyces sp. NBC_00569]|uniref:hypothetical protein n=1 Tax=Streptomyces sp. NBC_00569 TaxID=2975780 RepID=UPI002E803215|nr:hypothetical protein [Streptomyces sp. NBC_00569]WUB95768.1 hypothetical protein OHO83_27635 [Streptomyces sp. NBC_00569]